MVDVLYISKVVALDVIWLLCVFVIVLYFNIIVVMDYFCNMDDEILFVLQELGGVM